jgi:WD40 repeat protein
MSSRKITHYLFINKGDKNPMRRLFWIVPLIILIMPLSVVSAQGGVCSPQVIESANRLIGQARDLIDSGDTLTADAILAAVQELLLPCAEGVVDVPTEIPLPSRTPVLSPTPFPIPTVFPTSTPSFNAPSFDPPDDQAETVRFTFGNFSDDVRGVDFSPNGFYALASSFDSYLYLFDVTTGELVRQFEGHDDWVFNADFTRDGTMLASASADDTIRIWDVASATTTHVLREHTENVTNVAFSPDASLLVSTGQDNRVLVWDTATWEVVNTLNEHDDWVWDVAFSPDGNYFVTVDASHLGIVWDTATRRPIQRLVGHTGVVISVDYSPDGQYILTGSHDGTAILWDASTYEVVGVFRGAELRAVMDVAFSPDMTHVAIASFAGFIHIWLLDGTPVATYTGHATTGVWAVTFSPDGQTFLSGADDGGMLLNGLLP